MEQSNFTCEVGHFLKDGGHHGKTCCLSEHDWATHTTIVGPTGTGKSRLLWQMMREHRRQRRGFCVIDPGDLANDFLADCAAEVILSGNPALLKKIHYVKLNPLRMPRYNPWNETALSSVHPELRDFARHCWRHTRVQSLMQVFQAKTTGSTDFMNQPRAQRVMSNIFTALATEVEHRRLAMEDVFIFLDPSHKDHRRAVERVGPRLPYEIRQELELLGGFKRLEDLRRETESSINRLRTVLGPCMKAMLSGTGREPCLNLQAIIQRGDYLLVDVAQNSFAGHDENVALASLIALDLCETALNTPRAQRKKFTIFVDEVAEFLGPLGREIGRWLRIMRKYGVSFVLAFQDLASMRRDDLDLAPVVLGQCGTIVCFRNRWPDDNEALARILLTGNLSFEPLVHEVERHPGHQFLNIDEMSESIKQDKSKSVTNATSTTKSSIQTHTDGHSRHNNFSTGTNQQVVTGPDGEKVSAAKGKSDVRGGGDGQSSSDARGAMQAFGVTESATEGETNGWSVSVSHKIVPLPVVVRELQETGQLRTAASDQHEENRQWIHGLGQRRAVVLAPGMNNAMEIETAHVQDPFASPSAQEKAVTWIAHRLFERHPYYFAPSFAPEDQDRRVRQFLAEEKSHVEQADGPAETIAKKPSQGDGTGPSGAGDRDVRRSVLDAPADKEIPFSE